MKNGPMLTEHRAILVSAYRYYASKIHPVGLEPTTFGSEGWVQNLL
jgi:hypothetical protein